MRPSKTHIYLLLIWGAIALFVALSRNRLPNDVTEFALTVWWSFGLLYAVIAGLDIVWWKSRNANRQMHATRHMPGSFSLGSSNHIRIRIHNSSDNPHRLAVFDHYPAQVEVDAFPVKLRIPAHGYVDINYQAKAIRRGDARFGQIELRLTSRWRLWQFRAFVGRSAEVKIYPNFANISSVNLLAHKQQVGQLGIHLQQRRGQGIDFQQLREYRKGDTLSQIDWKASARQVKLISREYQDERDQDVLFLLDCGRRMRTLDTGYSHFDHALNAMLLTSYIALKQGDAVGLLTFSGQERWVAPIKGSNSINKLINMVYDLHSSTQNSDILQAAEQLMAQHRKRALVILISNIREEDQDDLLTATQVLTRQHLVMVASLREDFLDRSIHEPITDFNAALRYSGTQAFLEQRHKVLRNLLNRGVVITDSLAKDMHINLANEFLRLKRSGRI